MVMNFDLQAVRAQFPALSKPVIYFDNPGGTQIARSSLERIQAYLVNCNANHGGAFAASVESDAQVEAARVCHGGFLERSSPGGNYLRREYDHPYFPHQSQSGAAFPAGRYPGCDPFGP